MSLLTLDSYLMGRNLTHKDEYSGQLEANALDLIKRVNNLLNDLRIDAIKVSSGWRPSAINARAGGAKRSLHMQCKAVDLMDHDGLIKCAILSHPEKLLEYGLWMEHQDSTPGWCHLDTGVRSHRPIRVFKP